MSNNVLNQPSKLVDLLYFKKALGLSKKTSEERKQEEQKRPIKRKTKKLKSFKL
jgi:hypothetical protein